MRKIIDNSGIYILEIICKNNNNITHPKFSDQLAAAGRYFYIGSAQKNLNSRIKRHLSEKKNLRWHIDYITTNRNFKIKEVYISRLTKEYECEVVASLLNTGLFSSPLSKFGSSDCKKCKSHLLFSNDNEFLFINLLKKLKLGFINKSNS